jgi:hypothetical protein
LYGYNNWNNPDIFGSAIGRCRDARPTKGAAFSVRNQDIINFLIAVGFGHGTHKKPGFLSSEAANEAILAKTKRREIKEEQ